MIQTVVFDTKTYDREPLQRASAGLDIEWRFMDCRLSAETATAADGARAVCTFVNDSVDRRCLEVLSQLGVKHVALRCAGFNSIDLTAAKELGFSVTRVPAYSPYAVAEHAVGVIKLLCDRGSRRFLSCLAIGPDSSEIVNQACFCLSTNTISGMFGTLR